MRATRVSAASLALILAVTLLPAAPATAALKKWDSPVTVADVGSNVDVATDGTTVTAVWRGSDGLNARIQSATSADGGSTWTTPVTLSAEGDDARAPRVVTDGTTVTAIWQRFDGTHQRIQAASSTSGGAWSAPVTLSVEGQDARDPQIVTGGTTATAIWTRSDGETVRIQTSSSTNGGAWSTPVTLSAGGENGTGREPHLATDGTTITVVWSRFEGGVDRVQTVYSTNNGVDWSIPVDINAADERGRDPRVVTDGTRITVVWSLDTSPRGMQSASSTDGGANWSDPVDIVDTGFLTPAQPQVVTDGTTITAVWRISDGSNQRIQTASSSDGGATWSVPVFISGAGLSATFANLVTDGSTITATWFRNDPTDTDFPPQVQVSRSTNGGITFSTPRTLSSTDERATDPRLVTDGTTITVAWTNDNGISTGIAASSFSSPTVSRLAGSNRYETAVAISSEFDPGVPVVYLATGTNYPDALSAASAAAFQGGPLLLTTPTSLPKVIRNELARLNPDLVVIVGGTSVVSTTVTAQLESLLPSAQVRRDAGANRYETSRIIAANAFPAGVTTGAYIATGENFPDALSASAAAGKAGIPVILVNGASSTLDTATRNLFTTLGMNRAYIAGGTAVVSTGIQNRLITLFGASNVYRFAGADRYATSVAINEAEFEASVSNKVYLATGLDFADALAGAALAGNDGAPLFVVPRTCVPADVLAQIDILQARTVILLGGTSVLTSGVANLTRC